MTRRARSRLMNCSKHISIRSPHQRVAGTRRSASGEMADETFLPLAKAPDSHLHGSDPANRLGEGEKPKILRHDASQGYRLVNMKRPLKNHPQRKVFPTAGG
jgi:hypothetical protein